MKLFGFLYFLISILLVASACKHETTPLPSYDLIQGKTMGTYYKVSYQVPNAPSKKNIQKGIDSILNVVNDEMSTYIPSSFISRFNKSENLEEKVPEHFMNVLTTAKEIHTISQGAFDPSIMPLVNYWGFGYTGKVANKKWDSTEVVALLSVVGFDKINLTDGILNKEDRRSQLDFSAIAKGYAVDLLVNYMRSLEIDNLLIDIGGDGFAAGKNKSGNTWTLGINTPAIDAGLREVFIALRLDGYGLATSGNYRNYYEVDGELYGHTINVKTGFPFKSNVLSASVIAESSMLADALATTCMASNMEEGLAIIESIGNTEAYIIYEDDNGKMQQKYTSGFKDYILE